MRRRHAAVLGRVAATCGKWSYWSLSAVARFLNWTTAERERAMVNQMDTSVFLPRRHESQKVVIVNGSPDVLEMLESVLDPGHYDIVFVESGLRAYSQIKRVRPQLVIL